MIEVDLEDDISLLSDEDYHSRQEVSASILKRLVINDEAYEVANGIKTETTAAMTLGTLVHCLILEPHKFNDEFVVMPKCDLRTTAGKALKAEFEANANGKTIITESDYETALKCVASFNDSGLCKILEGGKSEQKFISTIDGEPARGMLDHYNENTGRIIDLKTTQNFADCFVKECGDRGYNLQGAFYFDLIKSLGKKATEVLFIGIQTKAPHKITIVKLNEIDIENGREMYKVGLDIWRDIKENTDNYKSALCTNPADGGVVFEYVQPMWLFYKVDKMKKQKGK